MLILFTVPEYVLCPWRKLLQKKCTYVILKTIFFNAEVVEIPSPQGEATISTRILAKKFHPFFHLSYDFSPWCTPTLVWYPMACNIVEVPENTHQSTHQSMYMLYRNRIHKILSKKCLSSFALPYLWYDVTTMCTYVQGIFTTWISHQEDTPGTLEI